MNATTVDRMIAEDATGLDLDEGPGRSRAPERTCVLNRRASAPDRLIRFVVAPDGQVTPDVKARLPGRGAWVTATRKALAETVRRKLFARAFKRDVRAADDLPDLVERLVEAQALSALSLANKAGAVICGFAKVDAAIMGERLALVLHASDASADGARKLGQSLRRRHPDAALRPPQSGPFTTEQLDLALGRMNVVHAAVLAGHAGDNMLARCKALEVYRLGDVAGAMPTALIDEPHTLNTNA